MMFGANKRLRDLGKDTSTMYNPSAYDSKNSKKIYVVNTKNNGGNQSIGTSNGATSIVKVIAFIYVGIFILSFFGVISSAFFDVENEKVVNHKNDSLVVSDVYEEEWANEFYYYLTQSYATAGIKCDEIALVDLNFDTKPELLIRSIGTGWADYIIEYNGDMKFNNIFVNDDIKELKLYKYTDGNYKWGVVKNISDVYALDPMLDTYWMNDVLNSNRYEPYIMSTFKSVFDQMYLYTNVEIKFNEMIESEEDFKTAIDNYYDLNDEINILKSN